MTQTETEAPLLDVGILTKLYRVSGGRCTWLQIRTLLFGSRVINGIMLTWPLHISTQHTLQFNKRKTTRPRTNRGCIAIILQSILIFIIRPKYWTLFVYKKYQWTYLVYIVCRKNNYETDTPKSFNLHC